MNKEDVKCPYFVDFSDDKTETYVCMFLQQPLYETLDACKTCPIRNDMQGGIGKNVK